MISLKQITNTTAKELNEDPDLVYKIAQYQFQFILDVMKDLDDVHDILIHKLFRFHLKPRFKIDKQRDYSPKI